METEFPGTPQYRVKAGLIQQTTSDLELSVSEVGLGDSEVATLHRAYDPTLGLPPLPYYFLLFGILVKFYDHPNLSRTALVGCL